MKNGKYSRKGSKRIVTLLLALVLILGCGIGGTLAYLTANTQEVKNTFVMGDIGTLTLTESDSDDADTDVNNNSYVVVPGVDITKDPKVTYTYARTETGYAEQPVYIFVTVDPVAEDNDASTTDKGWGYEAVTTGEGEAAVTTHTYSIGKGSDNKPLLSWAVDSAWSFLKEENGVQVYYMALNEADAGEDATTDIIAGNTIDVSDKIEMKHLDPANATDYIMDEVDNIVFKAYAIQQASFDTVEAAWNAVKTA